MSMLEELAVFLRPPDTRPTSQIEEEIFDELDFHIQMRTEDNIGAGMAPREARADALRRFGEFERIRRVCRQTLLGERIMLQRIQAVLMVVLLVAVIYLGWQFYRWQEAQNTSMTQIMQTLERLEKNSPAEQPSLKALAFVAKSAPPVVVSTVPETGAAEVDPGLAEIRVTFSKEMEDRSWSWVQTSEETFPQTNGDIYYLDDRKTCVMPVKLQPGKQYDIWLNTKEFHNFCDKSGQPAMPYHLSFQTGK